MNQKRDGFSLIELLVSIFLMVLLVAILWPQGPSCRNRKQYMLIRAVSNGANIYKSYFADQMDAHGMDGNTQIGWPQSGQYQSSTEFFIHLVTSKVMNVSYDYFAAGKIPPAKSVNAADFTAKNNAWRLVLDLDEAPEGTPFLFTRNYDPVHGVNPDGTILLKGEPFGDRGLVVVAKGGAAFYLKGWQLNAASFNSPGAKLTVVGP